MSATAWRWLGFTGRLHRRVFWPLAAPTIVLLLATSLAVPPLGAALAVIVLWPLASAAACRLHDVGRSGLWLLPIAALPMVMLGVLLMGNSMLTLILVASVNRTVSPAEIEHACVLTEEVLGWTLAGSLLATVAVLAWRGTRGANSYGPNPRTRSSTGH